jgi:hypothetical protein
MKRRRPGPPFGGALRECGREYRNSHEGRQLSVEIEGLYEGFAKQDKEMLDVGPLFARGDDPGARRRPERERRPQSEPSEQAGRREARCRKRA